MMTISKRYTKTLKDALYDTIHKSNSHSIEGLAEQLDMGVSYLYRAALPDPDTDGPTASGVRFPLKKVVPLCRLTGDYQILDVLEFQVGRVAIPISKNKNMSQQDVQEKALNAVVSFGKLIEGVHSSSADGVITAEEQTEIDRQGRQAIQAICMLLSLDDGE